MKYFLLLIYILFLSSCSKKLFSNNEQTIKFKNTDSHISVNLKIENYNKGCFYFDTGSGWLAIDNTFYKNQKMSFNNFTESEIIGVGNNVVKNTRIMDTIDFSLGNYNFYSEYNTVIDLKNILGKYIDGIVGFHNFRGAPFKIDYVTRKITLNPEIEEDYQEIKIKFNGYDMFLPMEIILSNGKTIQGNFLIDTGSKKIALTSEFTNNKGIINSKRTTYKNNGGAGGVSQGYTFFVPELKIDKYKLTNRLIDISIDTLGALSKDENYIGIIGNDVLDDFDIIYAPSQSKIWIKPNKNFNKPTEDLYKGFAMIEVVDTNKGWLVGGIYEECDAYKQGLRHRDEIIEINNKPVQKLNREKFIKKLKPNQKLKLKVKRKNEYFEINTHLNVFLKKDD